MPPEGSDAAAVIREALAVLWPGRFEATPLDRDVSLGEGGLELDSVDVVELVLECEARSGRNGFATGELLEGGPVTVGRLIDHLSGR